MGSAKDIFSNAKRVCIKLGTTRVVDENLKEREDFIANLACEINLMLNTSQVFCVASGAVALGRKDAGFEADQKLSVTEKQIAFGFGHAHHTALFQKCFSMAGLKPATGHLVAAHNFSDNTQKHILRGSFDGLLNTGATIVCNENDLTATDELTPGDDQKWGDNDNLSAQLASVMCADILLILTDVDGVYTDHPNNRGQHIPYLKAVTDEHLKMASGTGSSISTGGMLSKLQAAKHAQDHGVTTIIAKGENNGIKNIIEGRSKCTIIPPHHG